MSNGSRTRSGQEKVRQWCHRAIDKVKEMSEEKRLDAAQRLLDKAPSDSVRKKLVELSVSEADEITAAFVQAAVRDGSTELARAAADLLLDIKSADSARTVIEECLDAEDLSVKTRAVEALETLEDPHALKLLAQALDSEEDGVRRAATNSFGLVIGSKYHDLSELILEQLEDPESPLFQSITNSQDVYLRREIAQSLGFARNDRVLPLLEKLTQDNDEQTRREAVLALAAHNAEQATRLLLQTLEDPDDLVVSSVLDALLARYGRDSTKMLKALKKALQHAAPTVRRHAVLMLNQFDPNQVTDLLQEAAKDENFEVQRSATSLLRSMHQKAGAPTIAEPGQKRTQGEEALNIWEAGNIGMESETAQARSMMEARGETSKGDVVPVLERAATEGSQSTRQHAITELIELRDIADSRALRRALYDADEAIRTRVAPCLDSTRDAGLLVEVLQKHPDTTMRRRAVEALMDNPSGYTQGGEARKKLTFTSERSEGMILFSYFLEALNDYDEGVQQLAARAIGEFIEFDCPVPGPSTQKKLSELANKDSASSLTQDTAQEILEGLEDANLAEPIVKAMAGILDWRGDLARLAHAIKVTDDGDYRVNQGLGMDADELKKTWQNDLGLSDKQAQAAAQAYKNDDPLNPELANAVKTGVFEGLKCCVTAVFYASKALQAIGETQWAEQPDEWSEALKAGPTLEWDETEETETRRTTLIRLRQLARCSSLRAASQLKQSDLTQLEDLAHETNDSWVRLVALTTTAEGEEDFDGLDEISDLLKEHHEDPAFARPVGYGALLLTRRGRQNLGALESALNNADIDLRCDLVQALMTAAQDEDVTRSLQEHLSGREISEPSLAGMALALRGASGSVQNVGNIPDPIANMDGELLCALHALGAMDNQPDDADALKDMLRDGDAPERYCAASYLGLARVQSALPVWASASDQVEASWSLRALCAAMLVQSGHRLGIRWFAKNAQQRTRSQKPPMAIQLSRAVHNIIPLMLRCKTINLGRFV